MNEFAGLLANFKEGGLAMYGILGVGVVAAAIALERFLVITGASVLNGKKLTNDVIAQITRGDGGAGGALGAGAGGVEAPVRRGRRHRARHAPAHAPARAPERAREHLHAGR